MAKQGRYFRTKPKSLKGTPYDSLVEKSLAEGPLKVAKFHPDKIPYVSHHVYEPDFVYTDAKGIEWIIEAKSIFNDSKEASKYRWVREALREDQILVFVFEKPDQPIHWSSKRKDGTRQTMAEWAERNGFVWFTAETIHKILT